jgi:hypothetical protein
MTSTAAAPTNVDMRKVRFQSIEGIAREDLPLAYEIWLDELYKAPWGNRETMKLAAYLVRYMQKPHLTPLTPSDVETVCQLNAEEARKMLTAMRGFGVIENFVYDRKQVVIELNLTFLQRLRVLETKHRFGHLAMGAGKPWHLAPTSATPNEIAEAA